MNKLLFLALAVALASCEKEDVTTQEPSSDRKYMGSWKIYPTGNSSDPFSIRIWSTVDSLYNVEKSGLVSDGPVVIDLYQGHFYTIGFRKLTADSVFWIDSQGDTTQTVVHWHDFIHHRTQEPAQFIDSIPATIF